jgi:hypothetical protein
VHIVSTSDEVFTGIAVYLIQANGKEIEFPLSYDEIGPQEEKESWVYYPPNTISGGMRIKLRYCDASGLWWERINGERVHRTKRIRSHKC